MKITDIHIHRCEDPIVRAFVSFTIDDCFVIRGIRILEGQHGLFLAWPSRKRRDGSHEDFVHVVGSAAYASLEEAILQVYRNGPDGREPLFLSADP